MSCDCLSLLYYLNIYNSISQKSIYLLSTDITVQMCKGHNIRVENHPEKLLDTNIVDVLFFSE